MNTNIKNQIKQENILAILNNNIIRDECQKAAMLVMGVSSCQVACMSYKCCTGHGRGGKHFSQYHKIKH